MNITDYQAPPLPETWAKILELIFDRQRELMVAYKEIEQLPAWPISLHTAHGQKTLRDFAWRATEELAESYEAYEAGNKEHQYEELADSTHFMVELLIFAGVTAEQCHAKLMEFPMVNPWPGESADTTTFSTFVPARSYWNATYWLGIAMNFLRNKSWKQSQVPTDEGRFRAAIIDAFVAHVHVWSSVGLGPSAFYGFYFRKSEVNKFRQRSQY